MNSESSAVLQTALTTDVLSDKVIHYYKIHPHFNSSAVGQGELTDQCALICNRS